MSFRWIYANPEDGRAMEALQRELRVPETIARLLSIRGIHTFDHARNFFRPSLNLLHDPFLMKDMDKAASRLAQAIRDSEKVLVYGDYDVDGTTATAIVCMFLHDFGNRALHYIPHRFKEGYGISEDGIQYAIDNNVSLIVSVDCGITAVEEAKYARKKGIDLIICDHHTAGDVIPDAVAVLDPKRNDCTYPFNGLSGCGVGFKLIQATLSKLGLPQEVAYKFLDLVAISIASDIVPVIDENRIMMREGLRLINSDPRIGIESLMKLIKMEVGKVSTSAIVFSIGPRINAAGRMGDAITALNLLMADNEEDAVKHARDLESINLRRRKTDTDTMEQAKIMIDEHFDMDTTHAIVLHRDDWHLGVIGIVASRLVDLYCRPTIMLSTVDGKIKGSARSIKGFNIYDALKKCDGLLIQFGGHEYAAGLTMDPENLDAFRKQINGIATDCLCSDDFEPELLIDAEVDLHDIDIRFWKLLSQFEPYGPDNVKPVFVSKDVRIVGTPTVVGNGHLKLKVSQNGSAQFDAIGFNMHEHLLHLRDENRGAISMAFAVEENTWNKRTTLQMQIKDIKYGGS